MGLLSYRKSLTQAEKKIHSGGAHKQLIGNFFLLRKAEISTAEAEGTVHGKKGTYEATDF